MLKSESFTVKLRVQIIGGGLVSFNKIKKIIAIALMVSLVIPTINVQALGNENTNTAIIEDVKEENVEGSNEEGVPNKEEVSDESNTELENNLDEVNEVEEDLTEPQDLEGGLNNEGPENIIKSEEEVTSTIENEKENLKGKVYSTKKAKTSTNSLVRSFRATGIVVDEPEEYKIKKAELEDLEVLVTMTDSNYELTVANEDGSYEYVDSYDGFDEAKIAAVDLSVSGNVATDQVPAVVSNAGNVVYATNQMGRMLISRNNIITYSGNVDIYPTSDLVKAYTYANVASMEDVPVLDMTSKAAKVMINGYVGWIANDISSGTYNMKLVPLTKSINPSYYTVKNGDIVHFISYNLETGTTGANLTLGKAPSYLKEGSRYLSYDGNYFYEYTTGNGSNLSTKLDNLVGDYRTGSRMSSVNPSKPFYNYYQYLPFRSRTVYAAAELEKYITNNTASNSKLRGIGASLKDAETKYGVNAVLALAVAINESGFGNSNIAMTKNNLFGIAAFDSDPNQATNFANPGASVLEFSKNYISAGYADPSDWRFYGGFLGHKDRGANVKYASDPYWGEKAAQHAYSIDKYLSGGNTKLKDTNSKQIGMAISNNTVIKNDGTVLYKVTSDLNQYASYTYIPFIINDLQRININNNSYYEITPEITTKLVNSIDSKGKEVLNDFNGNYDWNTKGYILASDIRLLNVYTPQVNKVYGSDRYATSVELSKSQFGSAENVVLVNGTAIIDGVSATPLATALNAPILLTKTDTVPQNVKEEIKRLGAKNVIIVGGNGIVSTNVERELNSIGIANVGRLGGADRYITSLTVAKHIDNNIYNVEKIVVAAGNGEADALSISSIAGKDKMPIVLTKKDEIPSELLNWIKQQNIQDGYVIGGTGIISDKVLHLLNSIVKNDIINNRLAGNDRYETNARVIERIYGSVINKAYITVGLPLADSLGAGVVAALNDSPVILVNKDLSNLQKDVLRNKNTNNIVQVGGTVSQTAVQNLKDLLSRTE